MEKDTHSWTVTFLLCAALCGGNYWVMLYGGSVFGYLALWPVAFILCVVIASRFFRGHGEF